MLNTLTTGNTVNWGHRSLRVAVDAAPGRPVSARLGAGDTAQPLVEILTAAGRGRGSHRFSETAVGRRLLLVGSESGRDGRWHLLRILLQDPVTGLEAEVRFRSADGVGAFQTWTTVTNRGTEPVVLLGITSFSAGFGGAPVADLDLLHGESEWLGEGRWTRRPLREIAPGLDLPLHGQDGRGRFAAISTGAWSTGQRLPTGGLVGRASGAAWLWQVEHNGPWRWEVGERLDGAYAALTGPNDIDHQWQQLLAPGEQFTTVPASVAISDDGLDGAVAALTEHRRAMVRPRTGLPVIFNDYMNTLMADPTTEKLLPLIDAAAEAGAEIFCVDAGWYDDDGTWWDSVGAWEPSQSRFPRGIEEVLARIRGRGMVPGLWLEPEVVGVHSPVAGKLPPEAFLQRGGARIIEHDRYHLDLRHPAARAHLDETVDRLIQQFGIGYFKLDYNIDPGAGTDLDADSAGAGMLAHNRAHLEWLDGVLARYPGLLLENCASGGMRTDYAILTRMHLQSTSDQQNFALYPPVAVAAPLSILPEQAGNWAYPQPSMSDEEIAFTLCTGLLGRLYLSGRLDAMTPPQLDSVRAAVAVHREIIEDVAAATPLWPLGLPGWTDPWLALALRAGDTTYLTVWHRGGPASADLALPHLAGRDVQIEVLYPRHLPRFEHTFNKDAGRLSVADPTNETTTARLFRIR
jgi:alpha-galactosidase